MADTSASNDANFASWLCYGDGGWEPSGERTRSGGGGGLLMNVLPCAFYPAVPAAGDSLLGRVKINP